MHIFFHQHTKLNKLMWKPLKTTTRRLHWDVKLLSCPSWDINFSEDILTVGASVHWLSIGLGLGVKRNTVFIIYIFIKRIWKWAKSGFVKKKKYSCSAPVEFIIADSRIWYKDLFTRYLKAYRDALCSLSEPASYLPQKDECSYPCIWQVYRSHRRGPTEDTQNEREW